MKTGGLADVAGALPQALKGIGCDIRVVLPKYGIINDDYKGKFKRIAEFSVELTLNRDAIYCGVETFEYQDVTYYFIDNEAFFKRNRVYGFGDEGARFAYFSKAILEMLNYIHFIPDIIHINDWQLGLLPLFYKLYYQKHYQNIKIVLSIHNLKYQGSFDRMILDYCLIPQEYFDNGLTRHDGLVNYLKTGIALADCVSTVSPTYAHEIKHPFFGEGLDYMLNKEIVGILNGIDVTSYDPKNDHSIKVTYDKSHLDKKQENKKFLQHYFSLSERDIPIVIVISRLVKQKGLTLIIKAFHELMQLDCQFILLGNGDAEYERFFVGMSEQYPNKVRAVVDFNPILARFMYAGGDFILMPSIFEPCGLTQMIAMRYGTIPIVRQTGGLKDSVDIFDTHTLNGNGFGFQSQNEFDMLNVIKYAFEIYHNKTWFQKLRENAMTKEFSWKKSAENYQQLYKRLLT